MNRLLGKEGRTLVCSSIGMIDRGEWEGGKVYQPLLANDPIRDEGKLGTPRAQSRWPGVLRSMTRQGSSYKSDIEGQFSFYLTLIYILNFPPSTPTLHHHGDSCGPTDHRCPILQSC